MFIFILVMCFGATFAALLIAYYILELRPMIKEAKEALDDEKNGYDSF